MAAREHSPILQKPNNEDYVGDVEHNNMTRTDSHKNHNYTLSILCVIFGIGTWLPINAIFTEMPIFVRTAPEGWSLPSYFTLSVQIANVVPLLYYCFHKTLVNSQSFLICLFLCLSTIAIFLLAFTYDITTVIFGYSHSVYFFFFSIFPAALGCVSSVLFLPFMQNLPELYLTPFFIGEGLSGLIPGLISAVQDQDREVCKNGQVELIPPRFGISVFFSVIGCLLVLSTMSFIYLNYFSNFVEKAEKVPRENKNYQTETPNPEPLQCEAISKRSIVMLLFMQTSINCLSNGILPSIQSYSVASYGGGSYHWSVMLNLIISPLVMYIAFFVPFVSTKVLGVSMVSLSFCTIYQVLTAIMRPPPMAETTTGAFIIVLIWMMSAGLISYTKLSIASIFRRKHKAGLINYGFMTQVGSMLGAVLSFILINFLHIFQEEQKKKCT